MDNKQQELKELEKVCAPVVQYLRKKHPHYSITVDAETIKLNEAVMGVPCNSLKR